MEVGVSCNYCCQRYYRSILPYILQKEEVAINISVIPGKREPSAFLI